MQIRFTPDLPVHLGGFHKILVLKGQSRPRFIGGNNILYYCLRLSLSLESFVLHLSAFCRITIGVRIN